MPASAPSPSARSRLQWLYVLLGVLGVLVVPLRLAYLQLVEHSHYVALATGEQQRKYEVPADRGQIYLLDGTT